MSKHFLKWYNIFIFIGYIGYFQLFHLCSSTSWLTFLVFKVSNLKNTLLYVTLLLSAHLLENKQVYFFQVYFIRSLKPLYVQSFKSVAFMSLYSLNWSFGFLLICWHFLCIQGTGFLSETWIAYSHIISLFPLPPQSFVINSRPFNHFRSLKC